MRNAILHNINYKTNATRKISPEFYEKIRQILIMHQLWEITDLEKSNQNKNLWFNHKIQGKI